jgi:hypothetical protein
VSLEQPRAVVAADEAGHGLAQLIDGVVQLDPQALGRRRVGLPRVVVEALQEHRAAGRSSPTLSLLSAGSGFQRTQSVTPCMPYTACPRERCCSEPPPLVKAKAQLPAGHRCCPLLSPAPCPRHAPRALLTSPLSGVFGDAFKLEE